MRLPEYEERAFLLEKKHAEFTFDNIHMIENQFQKTNARIETLRTGNSETFRLNGTRSAIRPAEPDDMENLFQMHQRLSKETLYFRYLAPYQPAIKEMETVCTLSGTEGAAFVAQRNDPKGTIIGLMNGPMSIQWRPRFTCSPGRFSTGSISLAAAVWRIRSQAWIWGSICKGRGNKSGPVW